MCRTHARLSQVLIMGGTHPHSSKVIVLGGTNQHLSQVRDGTRPHNPILSNSYVWNLPTQFLSNNRGWNSPIKSNNYGWN